MALDLLRKYCQTIRQQTRRLAALVSSQKEDHMFAIKNILHPTDFSEPSEYAFQWACALAMDYQAQLTIMHVMRVPLVFNEGVIFPSLGPDQEELHETLDRLPLPGAG